MSKHHASVAITRGRGNQGFSIVIDGVEFGGKVKDGARVEYVHDQYGDGAEVTVTFVVDDLIIRDEALSTDFTEAPRCEGCGMQVSVGECAACAAVRSAAE